MKAIIRNKYGGVEKLLYEDVPKPEIMDTQVLVKVHAASHSLYGSWQVYSNLNLKF